MFLIKVDRMYIMFIFNIFVTEMVICMASKGEISTAYALSLAGGILIILGSIIRVFFMPYFIGWGMMMNGWRMMGGYIQPYGIMSIFSIIGLIAGVLVLIGAMKLQSQSDTSTWGALIIVFSVISFISGGGFLIGGILGLIGGILATISKS